MTTKVCVNCQRFFSSEDEICDSCKIINKKKIEQMANLVGAVEILALLRGVKDGDK